MLATVYFNSVLNILFLPDSNFNRLYIDKALILNDISPFNIPKIDYIFILFSLPVMPLPCNPSTPQNLGVRWWFSQNLFEKEKSLQCNYRWFILLKKLHFILLTDTEPCVSFYINDF